MYEEMIAYVKDIFENNSYSKDAGVTMRYPFRDRFEHILRVYNWAMRINEVEKGDAEILAIAAIFHDAGKPLNSSVPHAEISADICRGYLDKINYPKDKKERILHAILVHSSKAGTNLELNLEDRILMDADLLDEVGATAILWDSMAVALEENPSYIKAYERHLKYFGILKQQKKLIKTAYGKKLFSERLEFLGEFIKNLKFELGI